MAGFEVDHRTGHRLATVTLGRFPRQLLSGDLARPGVYEFPFGVSVREVLEASGGEDAHDSP